MSFQITIAPSGHQCKAESGETVLEAALNAGYLLPYNCRNGTCGACKGKVLEGRVDHGKAMESVLLPTERDAGEVLFCCATPLTNLTIECREFEAPGEIKVKRLASRVRRMYVAAPDVMVLQLELAASKRLQFLAGQYIDILLDDGRRRAFSLANAPHDDEVLELHIRRIAGGEFTGHVFEGLRLRDQLRIEGPHGNFYLHDAIDGDPLRPIIMIAGGTGFAPIKSMVQHAIYRNLKRPIYVYWGARRPDGLYMHELALEWARDHGNIHYIPVISEPQPEDDWQGRVGMVHQAVLDDWPDLSVSDVYLCGSEQMTVAARQDFAKRGLPEGHLYCDVFCASRDTTFIA
jgi:CDP-4-dehydro-6-deoxyglucose reductase